MVSKLIDFLIPFPPKPQDTIDGENNKDIINIISMNVRDYPTVSSIVSILRQ